MSGFAAKPGLPGCMACSTVPFAGQIRCTLAMAGSGAFLVARGYYAGASHDLTLRKVASSYFEQILILQFQCENFT